MYANNAASRVKSSHPPIKIALLEEKAGNIISYYCWSILLFFGHLISILTGISTQTSLSDFEKKGDLCPLFANFSNFTVDFNKNQVVGFEQIADNSSICAACRYISIICSAGAALLTIFYMKYLTHLNTSWKFRAFFITPYVVFFGLTFSTSVMTFSGFSSFCTNVQKFANHSGNDLLKNLSCEDLMFFKWKDSKTFVFSENALISQIGPVASLFGWGFGILALYSFRREIKNTIGQKVVKIEMGVDRARGQSESSTEGLLVKKKEKKSRKNQILCI